MTELSSHSSHQSQQSFTPISLDEFGNEIQEDSEEMQQNEEINTKPGQIKNSKKYAIII